MPEVLAGFVCGYGLALVATPLAAIALIRARQESPFIQRAMPEGTSLIAASIILHTFLFLVLTALGALLGMLLYGLESNSPAAGLGSPNRVFTAFVLCATAIAFLPLAIALPRQRGALVGAAIITLGVFGWLMPHLASWAPDQS